MIDLRKHFSRIFVASGSGACLALLVAVAGCSSMRMQEVTLVGSVTLQGQTAGHYGGVRVEIDGWRATVTDTTGEFEMTGYLGATEKITLIYSKSGYAILRSQESIVIEQSFFPEPKRIRVSHDPVRLNISAGAFGS